LGAAKSHWPNFLANAHKTEGILAPLPLFDEQGNFVWLLLWFSSTLVQTHMGVAQSSILHVSKDRLE
jgi:hypothetical protein